MSRVFNHCEIHGLGFFICFDIEVRRRRTKRAFSTFYTLIKHGFSTNQSTCKGPIYIISKNTMHVPINVKHIALGVGGGGIYQMHLWMVRTVTPLFLYTCENLAIFIFYSEPVETTKNHCETIQDN